MALNCAVITKSFRSSYFSELVENAPVVIDISSDLATELSAIAASAISFSQEDFKALTTDFGDQGNITIRIADTWTLMVRSILRSIRCSINLELDNNSAEKLQSLTMHILT